jgi:CheY-like chemotaxis protein
MAVLLVIDDTESIRQLVRQILIADGHDVLEAVDGLSGLRLVAAHAPELVVTDIVMPNKEGIETIREIRRIAPDTRIIAISGSLPARGQLYLDAAAKLGADATMRKPFRPADLRDTVRRLLAAPKTGS